MPTHHKTNFTSIAGLAVILMSITVMYGWFTQETAIIQISPSYAPMQFNTALCFLLSGLALLGLASYTRVLATAPALLALLISSATLYQDIAQTNLGIDQLLFESTVDTRTPNLGRMNEATAIAFIAFSIGCIWGAYLRPLIFICATITCALSILSLCNYAADIGETPAWELLLEMALHTAISFLICGIAMLAHGFSMSEKESEKLWRLAPLSISLLIIAMTVFTWYTASKAVRAQNQHKFHSIVQETGDLLQTRFQLYEQALLGTLGFFKSSDNITRAEWKSYINTLKIEQTLPGMSGIGYASVIKSEELNDYLATMRTQLSPDFNIYPQTEADTRYVIQYAEPMATNHKSIGLDLGFEAHRREAAEQARDQGSPQLTRKLELFSDDKARAGFIVFVPHYNGATVPRTLSERQERIEGWIYASFVGEEFLKSLSSNRHEELYFEVYDGAQTQEQYLIYKSKGSQGRDINDYETTTPINFASRQWTILWKAGHGSLFSGDERMSWIIVIIGMLTAIITYIVLSTLVKAKEAAITANKAKNDFLANISHELRNPLNSILGMVQILEKEGIDKGIRDTFDLIKSSSLSLLSIVNDILDLSKIESGGMELENDAFNATQKCHDTALRFQAVAVSKGLDFTIQIDQEQQEDDRFVIGDETRFATILSNIIDNAVQYTQQGQIDVKVSGIKLKNDLFNLRCEVKDTGIGIPNNKINSIFEKFRHADDTNIRQTSGTGLGLSITKKLVELMGGELGVFSQEGVGSVFWFEIPFKPASKEAIEDRQTKDRIKITQNADSVAKEIGAAKILLVEDQKMNQILMKKLFKSYKIENYEIAANGLEALEALEKSDFDVILMDCQMPEMDGYETTRAIRSLENSNKRQTPIIAMTADAMAGTEEECLKVGMNAYISKPVRIATFKDILSTWIVFEDEHSEVHIKTESEIE